MKRLFKLSLVVILISSFTLSPLFANKASAQWVVYDPANFAVNTITASIAMGQAIKEGSVSGGFGLDAIAWMIAKMMIQRMTAATVNWINSGFKGSPAFVTDPETYFKNIADGIAGEIIYNHPDLKYMCSPFKAKVQIALAKVYAKPPYQFQCTLSKIGNNWEGFMDDFSKGGWDGFIELTQNNQNNPVGLYLDMQSQMNDSTQQKTQQKKSELDQGRGFMSFEKCEHRTAPTKRTVVTSGHFDLQPDGTNKFIEGGTKEIEEPGRCLDSKTVTPGSVIAGSIDKALGVGQDELVTADEINEIISALFNQLVSKALGGLSSLVKGDSKNNEKNYLDQIDQEVKTQANILTADPVNGQCPAGFTMNEDLDSGAVTCYSSSSVQNAITSTNAAIDGARNTGTGVFNCKDTSCFSSEGTSDTPNTKGGAGRIGAGDIATTTRYGTPVNSNPNCGEAATLYPAGAEGFLGEFCPAGTTQVNTRIQFPTGGGTVAWQCIAYVNNVPTYNNCTATVPEPTTP